MPEEHADRAVRARSFGAAADAYERARPTYPEAAVDWLLPAGARTVLDLGAGTGKLTRSLAARGLEVIAVEPLAEMRAHIDAIGDPLAAARPARALAISDYGAERPSGTGVTLAFHYLEARLRETRVALTLLRSSEQKKLDWRGLFDTRHYETKVLQALYQPIAMIEQFCAAAQGSVVAYSAEGKAIRKETALLGLGIPLHPGAEKFYKEAGLAK